MRPGALGRAAARIGTAALPLLLALACGTTYVPADGTDTDGATDAADGNTGGDSGGAGGTPSGAGGTGDSSGGTSSDDGASGGAPATGGDSSGSGGDGSGGDAGEGHDCNSDHILCQPIVPPEPCPDGQVYSVQDACHGACVPIEQCVCSSAQDCPDPNGTDEYTCHQSTERCGPWVR